MGKGANITRARKDRLFKENKGQCYYCGCKVRQFDAQGLKRKDIPLDMATIDHWKPLIKGGFNTYKNMVVSCYACNQLKGSKSAISFLGCTIFYDFNIIRRMKND